MAKRNKSKKTYRRRRRRSVSGINSGAIQAVAMNIGGIAAGAFISKALTKIATNQETGEPKIDPKMLAGAKIIAAMFVPKFLPGEIGKAVGNGILAVASIELLQGFKVIQGIGSDTVDFAISGNDDLHLISGDENTLISGTGSGVGAYHNNMMVAGSL